MFFIITPHYNSQSFHRTFTSVTEQSIRDFIWVIVDDGSTENYKANAVRLANSDDRVVFLENGYGKFAGNARNFGLDYLASNYPDITNFYLTFIDADDEWDINHLETTLIAFSKYSVQMVSLSYRLMRPDGFVKEFVNSETPNLFRLSYMYTMACLSTSLFIESWKCLSGIRFGIMIRGNDQPFFIGAFRKLGGVVVIPSVTTTYNIGNSNSLSGNKLLQLGTRWKLLRETYSFNFFTALISCILAIVYGIKKYLLSQVRRCI